MDLHYTLIGPIMIASAFMSLLLAVYSWQRRFIAGGPWFTLLMVSITLWAFFAGLSAMVSDREMNILLYKLAYSGVVSVATLWFIFAVRYSGRDAWLKRSLLPLFWIWPVIALVAAWTNEYHYLTWTSIALVPGTSVPVFNYALGPLVFVNIVYSYVLLLIGMIIYVQATASTQKLYAMQTWVLFLAVIIPWLCNIAFVAGVFPPGIEPTPLAFVAASFLFAWSFYKYKLFDLLPVAHEDIVAGLSDGVVVVDEYNRIMEVNASAREYFHLPERCVGCPATGLIPCWSEVTTIIDERDDARADVKFEQGGTEARWFNIRMSRIKDRSGRPKGRLFIFRDISERKRGENDLMKLASLDSLTGVFNRRMGLIILERQLQLAKRLGSPLTICYIDIDGLKEVNDRYGHGEGDNLIVRIAKIISESIREQDSLCRLGGDEFLVIQPTCTTENAEVFRTRLDDSFKRLNRDHPRSYRYAASYGFAEYRPDMTVSVDKLINLADAAMYREKMKSRDSGQLQHLLRT